MRMSPVLPFAVFLLVAATLAACGGDDGGAPAPTPTLKTSASPTLAATIPAARPSPTTQPASSAQANPILARVSNDLAKGTYRVAYDLSGTDASGGKIEGVMTLAAKAPSSLFSLQGRFSGLTGNLTLIDDGVSSYLCIDSQGQKSCLKNKSGTATGNPVPLPSAFAIDELFKEISTDPSTKVTEAKAQTIAGREGKCFDFDSKSGKGSFCSSEKDSVLLLLDGTFTGVKLKAVAKDVSTSPEARDFEPPYPVVDISGR